MMSGRSFKGRLLVMVAVAGMLLSTARGPARAELADGPWPMFQHDLRHTGRSSTNSGPSTGSVRVKWAYKAIAIVRTSPTVGPDGTIYFGVGRNPLCALNPDGTLKWCTTGGGDAAISSPTVGVDPNGPGGPVIYMGARDNKLWAVKDNGPGSYTVQWRFKIHHDGDILSSPAIDPVTDNIYASCECFDSSPAFYALDAAPVDITDGLGEEVWSYPLPVSVHASSPAIDDRDFSPLGSATVNPNRGRIYIGTGDGSLHAFLPNGTHQWAIKVGSQNRQSSPVIADDGTIYVGTYEGVAAVVDNGAGAQQRWFFPTDGRADSAPALGHDGTVYIGTSKPKGKGAFHAINPVTGREKWRVTALDGEVFSAPTVGMNGVVYLAAGRSVYGFRDNGASASQLWTYRTGGAIQFSSPAIGPNGTLYVGSYDKKLYAIIDVTPAP